MKRYLVAALAVCLLASCGDKRDAAPGKGGDAKGKAPAKASVKAARPPRGEVTLTGAQPTGAPFL